MAEMENSARVFKSGSEEGDKVFPSIILHLCSCFRYFIVS